MRLEWSFVAALDGMGTAAREAPDGASSGKANAKRDVITVNVNLGFVSLAVLLSCFDRQARETRDFDWTR